MAFARTDEWQAVALACRPRLEAVGATPKHVLLIMPDSRLYVATHVHEFLVDHYVQCGGHAKTTGSTRAGGIR